MLNLLDVVTVEAMALQRGHMLIERIGWVTIGSDSLELCQAYDGVIEVWSPYTVILMDCFLVHPGLDQLLLNIAFGK